MKKFINSALVAACIASPAMAQDIQWQLTLDSVLDGQIAAGAAVYALDGSADQNQFILASSALNVQLAGYIEARSVAEVGSGTAPRVEFEIADGNHRVRYLGREVSTGVFEGSYFGSTGLTGDFRLDTNVAVEPYKTSCNEILLDNASATSGVYTIDPDGVGGSVAPFQAYCEMSAQGGGWTLVAVRDRVSYPAPVLQQVTDPTIGHGVLTSTKWMALRAVSTQVYGVGSNDTWATFNMSTLANSECIPLSQNLTASLLVNVEGDCNFAASDYSLIGSVHSHHNTIMYDWSNTPIMTQRGGTGWSLTVDQKPSTIPDTLKLYVK